MIYHPNPGFAPVHGTWNRGKGVKYWGCFFDGSRDMVVQNNIFVSTHTCIVSRSTFGAYFWTLSEHVWH